MEAQLQTLTKEIHHLAKGEFNINSPQQLREVLFNRLGLPTVRRRPRRGRLDGRRTCSRSWPSSTSCPGRSSSTGRSRSSRAPTSTPCPTLVNPETGRLHTSFNQTVAATGRLSSSDPNLQNIPIRTDEGRGSARPSSPAGGPAPLRRLLPDRAARPRPPLEGPHPRRHLPAGRGRARPHVARDLRLLRPSRGDEQRRILQDGQLRAAIRARRPSPRQGHRRCRADGSRGLHRGRPRTLPEGRSASPTR